MSDAVADFGRLVGQQQFGSGAPGAASRLEWEDGSQLDIVQLDDAYLVCLAFPAPHLQEADMLLALKMVDLRQGPRAESLQVGAMGHGIEARMVLAARVAIRGADGASLHQAFDRCLQWRHRWEAACRRGGQP